MNTEARANPTGLFRRKFPRRTFSKGVGFLHAGLYQVGKGIEIGEGGLSVVLPESYSIDTQIVVSFQIPRGSFVSIRAEVKTCRPSSNKTGYVLGCAFIDLSFDRKREIRSYVSARDQS